MRDTSICCLYWLPVARPQLGTWPATQACALTGNQIGELLVHRLALNSLSHTSQGQKHFKNEKQNNGTFTPVSCAPVSQLVTVEYSEEKFGNIVSVVSSLSPWDPPGLRFRNIPGRWLLLVGPVGGCEVGFPRAPVSWLQHPPILSVRPRLGGKSQCPDAPGPPYLLTDAQWARDAAFETQGVPSRSVKASKRPLQSKAWRT